MGPKQNNESLCSVSGFRRKPAKRVKHRSDLNRFGNKSGNIALDILKFRQKILKSALLKEEPKYTTVGEIFKETMTYCIDPVKFHTA